MIYLCDVNVWLALTLSGHFHARAARAWFDAVTEPRSVSFCRSTQQRFMRLLTTPAVAAQYDMAALSNQEAWAIYEALLGDERVTAVAEEPPGLEALWRTFSARPAASPKLWMDAYLAAFAVAGGYTLVTTDLAFRQFPGARPVVLGGP